MAVAGVGRWAGLHWKDRGGCRVVRRTVVKPGWLRWGKRLGRGRRRFQNRCCGRWSQKGSVGASCCSAIAPAPPLCKLRPSAGAPPLSEGLKCATILCLFLKLAGLTFS